MSSPVAPRFTSRQEQISGSQPPRRLSREPWCSVCVHAKSFQSCPIHCDPMDCHPPGSSVHGGFPGKNAGVGCCALLQGIFLIQGSNLSLLLLLHWQVGSLPLVPPVKPFHALSWWLYQFLMQDCPYRTPWPWWIPGIGLRSCACLGNCVHDHGLILVWSQIPVLWPSLHWTVFFSAPSPDSAWKCLPRSHLPLPPLLDLATPQRETSWLSCFISKTELITSYLPPHCFLGGITQI